MEEMLQKPRDPGHQRLCHLQHMASEVTLGIGVQVGQGEAVFLKL